MSWYGIIDTSGKTPHQNNDLRTVWKQDDRMDNEKKMIWNEHITSINQNTDEDCKR